MEYEHAPDDLMPQRAGPGASGRTVRFDNHDRSSRDHPMALDRARHDGRMDDEYPTRRVVDRPSGGSYHAQSTGRVEGSSDRIRSAAGSRGDDRHDRREPDTHPPRSLNRDHPIERVAVDRPSGRAFNERAGRRPEHDRYLGRPSDNRPHGVGGRNLSPERVTAGMGLEFSSGRTVNDHSTLRMANSYDRNRDERKQPPVLDQQVMPRSNSRASDRGSGRSPPLPPPPGTHDRPRNGVPQLSTHSGTRRPVSPSRVALEQYHRRQPEAKARPPPAAPARGITEPDRDYDRPPRGYEPREREIVALDQDYKRGTEHRPREPQSLNRDYRPTAQQVQQVEHPRAVGEFGRGKDYRGSGYAGRDRASSQRDGGPDRSMPEREETRKGVHPTRPREGGYNGRREEPGVHGMAGGSRRQHVDGHEWNARGYPRAGDRDRQYDGDLESTARADKTASDDGDMRSRKAQDRETSGTRCAAKITGAGEQPGYWSEQPVPLLLSATC